MITSEMRGGCLVYGQALSRKPDDGKRRILEVQLGVYEFTCPGCGEVHAYRSGKSGSPWVWTFNGSLSFPSFHPSLRARGTDGFCCHFFVTNGQIAFEKDCTHKFAGKTLELPEIEPIG
jgi:hypothetical protein